MIKINSVLSVVLFAFALMVLTFSPTHEEAAVPDCDFETCVSVFGCPGGLTECAAHMCDDNTWLFCYEPL